MKAKEAKAKHSFSDCSYCGGAVRLREVEMDYRHHGKLYIFQKVPAGVCSQCGEKFLTSKVAKTIERKITAGNPWKRTVEVPIGVFQEEVAV